MKLLKSKKVIIPIVIAGALISTGVILGIGGYFGGGDKIPEDTMTRGLVASWDFDEGQGDVAYDATTNNNHGNFPHTGPGLKFEGTDDYVEVADNASLRFGIADFAVEAWIKKETQTGTYDTIIAKGQTSATDWILYFVNSTQIRFYGDVGNIDSGNLTGASDGDWHHISFIRSGDNGYFYIDGVERSHITGIDNVNLSTTHKLSIGASEEGTTRFFNGSIDEVRIYSRAITATEVNEHYHGIFSDDTGRVGYWPFDEGSGDAVDNTGSCGAACDGDLSGYATAEQVAEYGDTHDTGWVTFGASNTDFAPSWTEGKSGMGLEFDGDNDYVDCGNDSSLNITDAITIEAWVKANSWSEHDSILGKTSSNFFDDGYALRYNGDNNTLEFWVVGAGGSYDITHAISASTVTTGTWYHVIGTYDKSDIRIFINAVEGTSYSYSASITDSGQSFFIGRPAVYDGYYFNGSIDGVKIYNRALSAEEVRYHYNRGGPVAHWKFDEGSGVSTNDATSNNNDGTLKSSALDFDGTNDYVDCGAHSSLDITDAITIEAWVKPSSLTTQYDFFTRGLYDTDGYYWHGLANGDIRFVTCQSGATQYSATGAGAITAGVWYHLVATKTGTGVGSVKLYVNGVDATTTQGDHANSASSSRHAYIGIYDDISSHKFNGYIDEVRIYNAALSAEEVARHYEGDFSQDPTANLVMLHHFEEGTSCTTGACITDDDAEGVNDGTPTNFDNLTVYDNGVDGWITEVKKPALRWTAGKHKTAGNFDGGGDYVDCGNDSSLNITGDITISAWVKINGFPPGGSPHYGCIRLLDKGISPTQGYSVYLTASSINIFGYGKADNIASKSTTWNLGEWYHIAISDNSGTVTFFKNGENVGSDTKTAGYVSSSHNLNIGRYRNSITEQFNGSIDDVKIYAYARSAEEIRLDYNAGFAAKFGGLAMSDISNCSRDPAACVDYGLVASYDMDEGSGDVAYDATTNNNHGNFPHTGPGLKFEGTDDYVDIDGVVSVLSATTTGTWEVWIKPTDATPAAAKIPISSGDTNVNSFIWIEQGTDGKISALTRIATVNQWLVETDNVVLSDNVWTHIALVQNGTEPVIYIDGVAVAQTFSVTTDKTVWFSDIAGLDNGNVGRLYILDAAYYEFNGSIDEVRIYSRALGAGEVNEHYHGIFSDDTGRVGYWPFDEGSGDVVDNSGTCGGTPANCDGDLNGYTPAEQVAEYGDTHDTGWVTFGASNTDFAPSWTNDTPPLHGGAGSSLRFDGEDDYVDCGTQSLGNVDITLEMWIKTSDTDDQYVLGGWSQGPQVQFTIDVGGEDKANMYSTASAVRISSTTSIDDGIWHHIVYQDTGITMKIFVDGLEEASGNAGSITWDNWVWDIGRSGGNYFNGSIDGVKIYNRALSAEEVRYHYNRGGPVAHWSFDEGAGAKAYDESGNRNHGTLIDATPGNGDGDTPPVWIEGKHGSALSFDGTDDYVDAPNLGLQNEGTVTFWFSSAIDLDSSDGQFSFIESNIGGLNNGDMRIGFEGDGTGGEAANGSIYFLQYEDGGNYTVDSSSVSWSADTWHHVVARWDGIDMSIYIDGIHQETKASTKGCFGKTDIYIGFREQDNNGFFNGSIDDVKIYAYARSAEEIRLDYNAGLAAKFGGLSGTDPDNCSRDPAACVDYGLVASYDMDEGDGDVAYDATTNNNHGNFPHTGPGLKFEGTDDYVDCGSDTSLDFGTGDFTLESWAKVNSLGTGLTILSKGDAGNGANKGVSLFKWTDNRVRVIITGDSEISAYSPTSFAMVVGTWYHVVVVKDSNMRVYINGESGTAVSSPAGTINTVKTFNIGEWSGSGSFFNGSIDEVRIYSRALGAAEVNEHYHGIFSNDANLVGYWPFDEGEGDVVDNSGTCGAACDGDLDGYTTAEQVAEYGDTNPTGWVTFGASNTDFAPSWTEGKEGGGLEFDGKNDYVNCGNDSSLDITDAITIEAWVYSNGTQSDWTSLITKGSWGEYGQYNLIYRTATLIRFSMGDGTSDPTVQVGAPSNNQWNHIVGVNDGTNTLLYINGIKSEGESSVGFTAQSLSDNVHIGGSTAEYIQYFNGSIDGVKIYNRALSAEEVRYHYNRGGPVAHWKMDEGEGAKAYDESGNRNHGTLTSFGTTDSGTADAESTTTTLVDAAKSWTINQWADGTVSIDSGTGNGQSRTVYSNTDDNIVVDTEWNPAPDATSGYSVKQAEEWVAGKYGSAILFDGQNDYVIVSHDSSLDFGTGDFTLEVWFKATGLETLLNNYTQGTTDQFVQLRIPSDTVCIVYRDSPISETAKCSNDVVVDGKWHHFVAVRRIDKIYIYLDGEQQSNVGDINADSCFDSYHNWSIGRQIHSSSRPFDGSIDDVKIYNYARTQEQILMDYNAGMGTHIK